jgi:alpha-L-fucosidase
MEKRCLTTLLTTAVISIASLSFGTTPAYTNLIVADGPVSFWPLNETSGTVIHDVVGPNNGTCINPGGLGLGGPGILYGQGVTTDTAIYFTNTAGGYITIPYSSALNTPRFTLEAWLNLPVFPVDGAVADMNPLAFDEAYPPKGWAFEIPYPNGNNPSMYGWLSSGSIWTRNNSGTCIQGTWSYYVLSYDGTTFKSYTNGVIAASNNSGYSQVDSSTPLYLGAYNNSGPARFYSGGLANVAVYNYALTPSQISAHFFYGTNFNTPFVTTQPASQTTYVGQTATFAVSAVGLPPLYYQWRTRAAASGADANLIASGQIAAVTNATLTISNLVLSNAADYMVLVTNAYGSTTSALATLIVLNPTLPSIIAQPASQTNYVGFTAVFAVGAAGPPPLSYQWRAGATGSGVYTNLIAGGQIAAVTNSSLPISNMALANAGDYVVVVTNAYGSITSAAATLTVQTNSAPQTTRQRNDRWFNQAKIGLMLSWGMQTGGKAGASSVVYSNAADFDAAASSWSADKWVGAAQQLHAKYIVLVTFHSCLGYLKTWRSSIPGTMQTGRDYLGELIDAAEPQGIKVIVYITPDGPGHAHDYGVNWMDSAAYSAYKGASNDLSTSVGWGQYSYDIVDELISNYPKVAGFWFDGWDGAWDALGLVSHIHARNDNLICTRNNFGNAPDHGTDAIALENYNKVFSPSYDYPSGCWVGPYEAESCFDDGSDWWWDGSFYGADATKDIRRIVTSAAASYNALLGEGPCITGDLPPGLNTLNGTINTFLNWAGESIFGTVGGGYDQGGFQPGAWNDGAYGCTTLVPGANTHYIHILTNPSSGNQVVIPDCGYTVTSAIDLYSNTPISYSQSGGNLTLTIPTWYTYDTIIKLTANPPRTLISHLNLSSAASAAVDGDYFSYYTSTNAFPQAITINCGPGATISGLKINQWEHSPVTTKGYAAPPPTRIKDYQVYLSSDGSTWGSPVLTGTLLNQRGVQQILFTSQAKQYVRFTATSNYAGTNLLEIANIEVFGSGGAMIQAGDGSLGVRSNRFGFDIVGPSNITFALEATTNLAGGPWTFLQYCGFTNGYFYFSDPQWTNYPCRFYRLRK